MNLTRIINDDSVANNSGYNDIASSENNNDDDTDFSGSSRAYPRDILY